MSCLRSLLLIGAVALTVSVAAPSIEMASAADAKTAATEKTDAAPLQLVAAGFWGGDGEADLESAAQAPDGSIYLVGNISASPAALLGGIKPTVFGQPQAEAHCQHAFVAHFSADMTRLLHYAELAEGIAQFTTVAVNSQGVYVSGYASEGLEPLLAGKPSLTPKYPLREAAQLIKDGKILAANGLKDKDPLEGRLWLGRLGAPFVIRFTADLSSIDAGTYLEGWQQVWDKFRCKTIRPMTTFPREFFWQPTSLGLMKSGDVAVCHDGGYFRVLTDDDRKLAGDNEALLKHLAFYDCCDWLSRLSPDLSKRVWRQAVYSPTIDAETAKRVLGGWPLDHYSNPRTVRMRLDGGDHIYLAGWSASATVHEPWWAPYVWKLDSDGKPLWKAYEYSPISGADNRMNGNVADTGVATVALDHDGNVLSSLYSDGGNNFTSASPKAKFGEKFEAPIKGSAEGVKLVHWWGTIHRFDAQTREGLGGARMASKTKGAAGPAWVVDMGSTADNRTLAVGRTNFDFPWTGNAWSEGNAEENPMAFLRLYSPQFDLQFSTPLPGVVPFEILPLGGDRFVIVGRAENGSAPVKNSIGQPFSGKSAGYYMIVDATRKADAQ